MHTLKRFLQWARSTTPTGTWSGTVYHGSPPDGLLDLLHEPQVQDHHLGMFLSVSSNDNVVDTFSETTHAETGESHGFGACWNLHNITIRDFRDQPRAHNVLASLRCFHPAGWKPGLAEELLQLGFCLEHPQHGAYIHPDLARWEDHLAVFAFGRSQGLALENFDRRFSRMSENELALTTRGCSLLTPASLDMLYVADDWFEPAEGLRRLREYVGDTSYKSDRLSA